MGMVLTEEQVLLKDSARDFVAAKAPVKALRALRDAEGDKGFDTALWAQMVEMGWAGMIFPEEFGGLDFGYQGLGLVLEETGRSLAASPLVSTVLTCGTLVMLGGNAAQKADLLPKIAAGELVMSLALEEKPHHAPYHITSFATPRDGGFVLTGDKQFVLDAAQADTFIVVARSAGAAGERDGLTLCLVPADAPGVTVTPLSMVDSRSMGLVSFDAVAIGADAVLGEAGKGADILDPALDRVRIGMAAEMLGSAQECFDRTMAYLKTRTQFGQLIGSFQALKHRAAEMFSELELTRAAVTEALSAIDGGRDDVALLASLAKARANDTLNLVSREGIQMHGGIGMTDEEEIGFFIKRARVAESAFGNSRFHRDRYAALSGY